MKSFYYIFALLITTPFVLHAQISSPLLQFPQGGTTNFDTYINWLYVFSISIAALLAVVKIIIAGFKYITSDVISNKSEAKDDIKGALLGLLLILGAYIILNTINPNLVGGTINIKPVSTTTANVQTSGGGGVTPITQNNPNPSPAGTPPVTENEPSQIIPTMCVPKARVVENTSSRYITEFDFRDCSQGRSVAVRESRDNCNSVRVPRKVEPHFGPKSTHIYRCTITYL